MTLKKTHRSICIQKQEQAQQFELPITDTTCREKKASKHPSEDPDVSGFPTEESGRRLDDGTKC